MYLLATKHTEKTNRRQFGKCMYAAGMRCKQSLRHVRSVTVWVQPQRQVGGSVLQLYRTSYAVRSAFLAIATVLFFVEFNIAVQFGNIAYICVSAVKTDRT